MERFCCDGCQADDLHNGGLSEGQQCLRGAEHTMWMVPMQWLVGSTTMGRGLGNDCTGGLSIEQKDHYEVNEIQGRVDGD